MKSETKSEAGAAWWAGSNDEWFTVGPCETREMAIHEARGNFGDDGFYVVRAARREISFSAQQLIEQQYFENEDLFSYEYGDEPDRLEGSAEADAELQAFLDDWAEKHRRTFAGPSLFAWTDNREWIEPAKEAAA